MKKAGSVVKKAVGTIKHHPAHPASKIAASAAHDGKAALRAARCSLPLAPLDWIWTAQWKKLNTWKLEKHNLINFTAFGNFEFDSQASPHPPHDCFKSIGVVAVQAKETAQRLEARKTDKAADGKVGAESRCLPCSFRDYKFCSRQPSGR